MVYDVTDKETFEAIDSWMQLIDQHAPESAVRMLVGNKSDLDEKRVISYEQGKELAEKYNIKFIETSARRMNNVVEAFIKMCNEITARIIPTKSIGYLRTSKNESEKREEKVKLTNRKSLTTSSCC